jgi:NADH:ubiquinone oxidoreductase subunit 6 (subunit J)
MLGASRAGKFKNRFELTTSSRLFHHHGVSMDSLHAIGFYVSSGVSLAGGLGVALLPRRTQRGLAMGVTGLGLAGIYLTLSAGFAAAIALVCYAGCAALIAASQYRSLEGVATSLWRQLGAIGAAGLLALLAYTAFRADFARGGFAGGTFNAGSVGRVLFAHDALATEAVAALILVALAGAAAAWRLRERVR